MKRVYKPRYANCHCSELTNAVEPNQSMTPQQLLVAFTRGMDLPSKIGTYDEGITIDEVGYAVADRLEAVDYLNSVNQRIAQSKLTAKMSQETVVETPQTDVE